jgi:hypothetical protein
VIYGLDDAGDFIHESDGTSYVIQDRDFTDLLPRIWYVLEELHYGMRDILERTKMDTLVISELPIAHITMVLDNFPNVFGG